MADLQGRLLREAQGRFSLMHMSSNYGTKPLCPNRKLSPKLKFKEEAQVMWNWNELHRNSTNSLPECAETDVRKDKVSWSWNSWGMWKSTRWTSTGTLIENSKSKKNRDSVFSRAEDLVTRTQNRLRYSMTPLPWFLPARFPSGLPSPWS